MTAKVLPLPTRQPTVKRVSRNIGRGDSGRVTARSTLMVVQRADDSTSRQTYYEDEFNRVQGVGDIILPTVYDVFQLYKLIERSNMLPQCIDAMVVNTVGTGWEVQPRSKSGKVDKKEQDELQSFIDNANSEESLVTVMSEAVRDRESVGFGFVEIIRDKKGAISLLRHAPSWNTRLSFRHPDEVKVEYDILRGKRVIPVVEYRRFRRFVQVVNGRYTWFKEFGDPRRLNSDSGAFEGESRFDPKKPMATEILHLKKPSTDPYGVPSWINQVPNIRGSRESEEVNMRYFEDNTVPPMMLTVGGGRLTTASYKELRKMLDADKGVERQNKIMLIEAVGESDSLDGKSSPITINVEKLTDARQSDALFKQYDEGNQNKVRSSFRLPPVAVGMSNEHNFATANVAMFAAESQVFGPARAKDDEILNNRLVQHRRGLNMKSVKLVSRTPPITSPEMLIKSLTAINVMGAVTPRMAQQQANKVLQIELPEYPQRGEENYEDWMDRPMPLTASRGNPDDAADPNSPEHVDNAGSGVANTDAMQNQKDAATKQTEKDGTLRQQPKHGEE